MLNFYFTGTAGDCLSWHNGMKFSTRDVDNDPNTGSCAQKYHGAWWFKNCLQSNLNGEYLNVNQKKKHKGVYWYRFKGTYYSYKMSEMKVGHDQN